VSNVTNVVVLSSSFFNRRAMEPFLELDDRRGWKGAFGIATEGPFQAAWIHNGKAPECTVWVGAFNHLNRPALLRDLAALPWEEPGAVQVLINGQDDDCFGLWMFQGSDLVEVSLPGLARVPMTAWTSGDHEVEVGRLERLSPAQ
jgi:hypothetical protein